MTPASPELFRTWAEARIEHLLRIPPDLEGGPAALENLVLTTMEIWAMALDGRIIRPNIVNLFLEAKRDVGIPFPLPVYVARPLDFQGTLAVIVEKMQERLRGE